MAFMNTNYATANMSKAQIKQLQRIKQDEMIAEQEQQAKNALKANLKSSWMEALEESSMKKILKKRNEAIEQEVVLGNKAVREMRRAQLKELLAKEHQMYLEELTQLGLTFHTDRM